MRDLLAALLADTRGERPGDGRAAAQLIAVTAEKMGIDLAAARASFGRIVSGLSATDAPPEPGTWAATPPPAAPPAPRPPTALVPPSGIGAGEPYRHRPEGVGAGPDPLPPLFRYREFLDVSSKAIAWRPQPRAVDKPPSTMVAASAAPAAAAVSAPATPQALVRRAAARWYRRMNPHRNFPLSVVLSGKQIRIVGGSGLGITLGQREIVLDPADPVLAIEPWFPGCLISPPRAEVHVSEETTVCRFWITPLVCGDLSEACVTIRHRGKVVETLETPAEVVTRTTAKVLAVLGVIAPIVSNGLSVLGYAPADLLRQSLPYAADLVAALGPAATGATLAGILLTAAVFHFYVTRPLLSEEAEPGLLPQPA
jgi:hypothetical protein